KRLSFLYSERGAAPVGVNLRPVSRQQAAPQPARGVSSMAPRPNGKDTASKHSPGRPQPASSAPVRIAIDCLNCGHCTSVSQDKLSRFGLEPNVTLVTLSKRLVCKECGGKAVRVFRYVEDGPTLVPKGG